MFWSDKRKSRNYSAEVGGGKTAKNPRHLSKNKKNKKNNKIQVVDKQPYYQRYIDVLPQTNTYMMLQKKEPHIITAASSTIGNREEQQDSFFVTKSVELSPFKLRRSLAVVCDGMGGLEAGDRASLTAVEILKFAFGKLPTKKVDIPKFYHDMLENIDSEIFHWEDLESDRGAGTTLASVLIENKRLYWANVGDSSIFIIQDGKLKRITREHNYALCLSELVSDGKISQQDADADPRKNALVSYLGMGGLTYMDITSKPYVLRDGDILLLCTDGVTNTLSEDEILSIVEEYSDDVYRCCRKITAAVNEKNMDIQDNATAVIVQYVE